MTRPGLGLSEVCVVMLISYNPLASLQVSQVTYNYIEYMSRCLEVL